MARISSIVLTLLLSGFFFAGCKNASSKQSAPQPSTSSDPACKSQSVESCAALPNCAVDGTKCAGSGVYCAEFKTASSCPKSSCDWSGKVCVSGVVPAQPAPVVGGQCAALPITSCNTSPGCSWTGTVCMSVSTPPQCTAYTTEICPTISGCGVINNLCESQESNNCSSYPTQPTCSAVRGCSWDVSCKPTNAVVNCALNKTQVLCAAQSICSWVGNFCVNSLTTNTCQGYLTQPSCPTNLGCVWNGTTCDVIGAPTANCSSLSGNGSACEGAKGCQWMNNTCVPSVCKGVSVLKCATSPNCHYIPFAGCYPGG